MAKRQDPKRGKRRVTIFNLPTKVDRRHNVTDPAKWIKSGKEVRVRSSWVFSIKYDSAKKSLYVTFKRGRVNQPGTTVRYDNIPRPLARDMFLAMSMGKYVWARLYSRPYTVVARR